MATGVLEALAEALPLGLAEALLLELLLELLHAASVAARASPAMPNVTARRGCRDCTDFMTCSLLAPTAQ
jgi:hypothetical protein